jgi:ankyrin repeat protein
MFAAANGQSEVVGFLIESGADVNAANTESWTPLMMAALGGHVGTAQALINGGADMSARADVGMTPLIMAAASGHAAMVTSLLDNGASADDATPDGRTVLMTAAEGGHAECVTALLESGADPHVEAPGGFTALAAAQRNGHTAVAWTLIDAGAVFIASPGVMPELVSYPELEVPDSLDTAPIEGSIVIQFIVDVEGKVEPESIEITESPHEGLNEPVRQMALGAVFKPGQFEGEPVRVRIRQSLSFGG